MTENRKHSILLVDDDVYGRDMLRFALESAGHQVVWCGTKEHQINCSCQLSAVS